MDIDRYLFLDAFHVIYFEQCSTSRPSRQGLEQYHRRWKFISLYRDQSEQRRQITGYLQFTFAPSLALFFLSRAMRPMKKKSRPYNLNLTLISWIIHFKKINIDWLEWKDTNEQAIIFDPKTDQFQP